jgi:L-amino acid N-acyltransferase YncA
MPEDLLTIRAYRTEDAVLIREIYQYYILNGPYTFETVVPNMDEFGARLDAIAARFPFYILEQNHTVAGYAYACAHRERAAYRWAVETSIYLAKDFTGKGYGKKMYNTLLNTLTQRNFTHAFALIGMPNENSILLHKSCGFEVQGVHEKAGWKNGEWIDVCWMRCPLADPQEFPAEPEFRPLP